MIETDKNIIELARKFIDFGVRQEKRFYDCQRIAVAILTGCYEKGHREDYGIVLKRKCV